MGFLWADDMAKTMYYYINIYFVLQGIRNGKRNSETDKIGDLMEHSKSDDQNLKTKLKLYYPVKYNF